MADEIDSATGAGMQRGSEAASWILPSFLGAIPADARLEMLLLYRKGLQEQMAGLEAALAGGAGFPGAVSIAHKIAGSAGMMQDRALADVARQLEDHLRAGLESGVPEIAERLAARARLSLDVIEQAMG